jgi:hypothetical protein
MRGCRTESGCAQRVSQRGFAQTTVHFLHQRRGVFEEQRRLVGGGVTLRSSSSRQFSTYFCTIAAFFRAVATVIISCRVHEAGHASLSKASCHAPLHGPRRHRRSARPAAPRGARGAGRGARGARLERVVALDPPPARAVPGLQHPHVALPVHVHLSIHARGSGHERSLALRAARRGRVPGHEAADTCTSRTPLPPDCGRM